MPLPTPTDTFQFVPAKGWFGLSDTRPGAVSQDKKIWKKYFLRQMLHNLFASCGNAWWLWLWLFFFSFFLYHLTIVGLAILEKCRLVNLPLLQFSGVLNFRTRHFQGSFRICLC